MPHQQIHNFQCVERSSPAQGTNTLPVVPVPHPEVFVYGLCHAFFPSVFKLHQAIQQRNRCLHVHTSQVAIVHLYAYVSLHNSIRYAQTSIFKNCVASSPLKFQAQDSTPTQSRTSDHNTSLIEQHAFGYFDALLDVAVHQMSGPFTPSMGSHPLHLVICLIFGMQRLPDDSLYVGCQLITSIAQL